MVSRLSSAASEENSPGVGSVPALVIDLDGTYVRGNTFRIYIRLALADAVRQGRLPEAAGIGALLLLRRCRLISHRRMKFGILRLTSGRVPKGFGSKVGCMVNPEVRTYVDNRRKCGWQVLMASAAPDFYIPHIWDGPFVATKSINNETMTECRGKEKQRRVGLELSRTGAVMREFMTDHPDDLPLWEANAAAGGTNILVDADGNLRVGVRLG